MPAQFWDLTVADFNALVRGHRKRDENEWRRVRWLGALMANMSGKQLRRKMRESDFIRLPGDEAENAAYMSKQRFEELKKRWN